MTQPRRLAAGQTHSATRRVARRCPLLKPVDFVNQVVLYSLAYAASKHQILIHAFVAESNHTHINCTDQSDENELSQLPGFFARFHRMVAAALNTFYGREENFWRDGSYDNVEIHSEASLEQQLLYLWTNPVRDGLVDRPEDWPGVIFLPEDFGKTFRVQRPQGAFFGGRRPKPQASEPETAPLPSWQEELNRERQEAYELLRGKPKRRRRPRRSRSTLPEFVEFTLAPPPAYEDMPIEEVRRHFRNLLNAEVERIHELRRAAGRTRSMGRKAILEQDPRESPEETRPTFALNPRIACKGDTPRRIKILVGMTEWRASYRLAYEALVAKGKATFPRGTYGLAKTPAVVTRRRAPPPVVAA